ncbi:ligase-associated DNA damage response DEXH box helicase [Pleomorphovibrio marinus]|uniref:ligase-associated DNA damage response DEXH box helicase n=1 Tax=Pleomorphovibrio marinus TaxID=2164132 RepID=UPI000E0B86DC|nr:ligase-associated DNA damage response DEXH box helicase [Pleomorphovibrio marinus]
MENNLGKQIAVAENWFSERGWKPFDFQYEAWDSYLQGKSGLLNAPTGSGKTLALWFPVLLEYIAEHPNSWKTRKKNGLRILWVTPLRALAKDIHQAMQQVCDELGLPWRIALRNGDTPSSERQKQKRNMPECLVTTPESLHLLLSQKDAHLLFSGLQSVIVDEWHELLSNKRGIQVQLALCWLKNLSKIPIKIWGISATIGNMEQAHQVLLGEKEPIHIIKSQLPKEIIVTSILPKEVEKYPWTGHLGIKLLPQILPIIAKSQTTLLFTNTRSQTEIWYQKILEKRPDWAGIMAMHHGSLDQEVRTWVENALHNKQLRLVVCTSSLDLGVDFRPVDTVIQVGGPKGVSRFVQRAGRANHQPGMPSEIFFVPTHALELIEASAMRKAIKEEKFEEQVPLENCYDVLIQFMVTLALGDGFFPEEAFTSISSTYTYKSINKASFHWVLDFITKGGRALGSYEEYAKVEVESDGKFKVNNRKTAMRHRLSIGTIVSDPMLKIKYMTGGYVGTVEESFISKLKPHDVFWFGGKSLEFIQLKDMSVLVRRSKKKTSIIPRWMGGRMPLSSRLSEVIREELQEMSVGKLNSPELQTIQPIVALQQELSIIPPKDGLLIEAISTREGFHMFMFPFEGRFVHDVLAALVAYRISVSFPVSFSIAMNDYGFELLCDTSFDVEEVLASDLFRMENLLEDILASVNESEMARRRFREIAAIAGLVFQGFPGKGVNTKHLQATSGILYGVFEDYEPDSLLLKQAREEVLQVQMEKDRLLQVVKRIGGQKLILKRPQRVTPFAFPIMVDRLSRATLSSESLEDRVMKMQARLLR